MSFQRAVQAARGMSTNQRFGAEVPENFHPGRRVGKGSMDVESEVSGQQLGGVSSGMRGNRGDKPDDTGYSETVEDSVIKSHFIAEYNSAWGANPTDDQVTEFMKMGQIGRLDTIRLITNGNRLYHERVTQEESILLRKAVHDRLQNANPARSQVEPNPDGFGFQKPAARVPVPVPTGLGVTGSKRKQGHIGGLDEQLPEDQARKQPKPEKVPENGDGSGGMPMDVNPPVNTIGAPVIPPRPKRPAPVLEDNVAMDIAGGGRGGWSLGGPSGSFSNVNAFTGGPNWGFVHKSYFF